MLSYAPSFQDVPATPTSQSGGPQFGDALRTRPENNLRFFIIVFVVLAGGALWARSNHSSDLLARLVKQTESLKTSVSQNIALPQTKAPGITLELKNDGITTKIPGNQINIITEQAQRGDGVTHLARRAITERLQDASLSLSPEQRIYAEDFVRKVTSSTAIRNGQKLSFATDLLDHAIQKAQQLSPRQIQNLSRYSARVHF